MIFKKRVFVRFSVATCVVCKGVPTKLLENVIRKTCIAFSKRVAKTCGKLLPLLSETTVTTYGKNPVLIKCVVAT